MKFFKDVKGDDWEVEVTVATAIRLMNCSLKFNIDDLQDYMHRLSIDPIFLCNVLYMVCKPQCDERKITDEQFGARLGGQAISDATDAFIQEALSYFPKFKRDAQLAIWTKQKEMEERLYKNMEVQTENPMLEKAVKAALKEHSNTFSKSLELLASAPSGTAPDNSSGCTKPETKTSGTEQPVSAP